MNRILVVHRDRSALDRLEKLLLDRADYQITLADGFRQAVVDGNPNLLETITSHVVQKTIEEALRHTGGNRSQAARLLGVSRPTLLAKIRKHGIR